MSVRVPAVTPSEAEGVYWNRFLHCAMLSIASVEMTVWGQPKSAVFTWGRKMKKRIIITGATGFIGKPLSIALAGAGYEVVALSRRRAEAETIFVGNIKVVEWDAVTASQWSEQVDGALAIVNLAGDNIGAGRWSEKKKKLILESRLNAGAAVTEAIRSAEHKPEVLIQASGVGC